VEEIWKIVESYCGYDFWKKHGRQRYAYTFPRNGVYPVTPTGNCNFSSIDDAKAHLDEELEGIGKGYLAYRQV
jgi:hypothetical protein